MSTTHHTAITTGAAANAATVNSPLGELDAAIVAADLTSGGDIDGTLGISETTISTGTKLAVGGGISVTNGAGTDIVFLRDDEAKIGEYILFGNLPEVSAGETLTIDITQTSALHWLSYYVIGVDITIQQASSSNGIAVSEKLIIQAKDNATATLNKTLYSDNQQVNVTYTRSFITGGIRYSITNNSGSNFGTYSNSSFVMCRVLGHLMQDFEISSTVA